MEHRLCLSAVRIVSWNTANGPDNSAEDALFRTVFEAIGNETLEGNARAPSIVALQETDTAQFGGNSIARIDAILESLYPNSNYQTAASPLDTGDDANGFVYDASIFDLVSTRVVDEIGSMQAFAHNILRGHFRPIGTSGSRDFYIYSTHLKAGSTGVDSARRGNEAAAIRADIDALGPNRDVLVVGDFNISGSSETAYRNFLSDGNGQLFDPIDAPGEWKNNPAYVDIHTQNPAIGGAGGMDDRFDFQLGTAAVFDGEGLQFVDGTYRAFGNNGTHVFNSDITTGSGASAEVLLALANASDHLPVIADYEIDIALAGVSLATSDPLTTLIEGGPGDAYSIVLDTVPSADVNITITTDGQTRVSGETSTTITFTPSDALIPKLLTVTAVADGIAEGNHLSEITHSIQSDDASYNSLPSRVLSVPLVDVDSPTVTISEIMYNPSSDEPDAEWVEIVNLGPGSVDISGWWLDDEDTSDWGAIPQGTSPLAVGEIAILHNQSISAATFRDRWSLPNEARVIPVRWASLANSPSAGNEMLELRDARGGRQDYVNFDDDGVIWPADNNASSIYLPDVRRDNDNGNHWSLSTPGIDGAIHPSGDPFHTADIASPGFVPRLNLSPPQLIETRFDRLTDHPSQRSMLRSVTMVFDTVVSTDANAFELIRRDDDNQETRTISVRAVENRVNDRSEITLTFSGSNVEPASGSLVDGAYQLTLLADSIVAVTTGLSLDGNADGQAGDNRVIGERETDGFFRLFGDGNGDRDVDAQDFGAFTRTFLKSSSESDFDARFDRDADGDVDSRDLGQIRRRLFG